MIKATLGRPLPWIFLTPFGSLSFFRSTLRPSQEVSIIMAKLHNDEKD
ncbi:uncharacterized protein METZ01_LOCUS48106 [marine metagenome]|uniref:Uncharacterized protein n=1 Tax=marine metagenome TaxID=408172 RepID=A0A381RTQ4_9ZZZZ